MSRGADYPDLSQNLVSDAGKREWKSMCEGVETCTLLKDPERDFSVMLLRYEPGASAPRHGHPEGEQFYVISGTIVDEQGRYGPGTFVNRPPTSEHTPSSPDGALVLVTWFGRLTAY